MIEATSCWSAWDPESLVLDAPVMLDTLVDGTQRLANPVLSPTSLVLSYVSNTGAGDIMSATRTAIDQPWIPAGPITELDTTEEEGRFVTTLDGLVGIYVRGNPTRLVETRRATSRDPWGPPSASPFVDNTSAANLYDPEIARDGLRVYYSNGADILVATRTSRDAAFAGPTVVDITGTTSVADPVLSPDERVLVFSRTGASQRDLYVASRSDVDGPFGAPVKLPLSTDAHDEGDADLSEDGCELVFSSNRNGRQIWSSRMMR